MKKILPMLLLSCATLSIAGAASAASGDDAAYSAAKNQAKADYKVAHEKCTALKGNPKDVCVAETKAARERTEETAEAEYKNTDNARAHARKEIAQADYKVAKAKCDALKGNDNDVCVKNAKAAEITAKANATADKKVSAARTDATEDKRKAEYKVELEKCDAMAGPAKDACVARAKTTYGK